MNTRKDYIRAAEIVKNAPTANLSICVAFVKFFREDNPRFDAKRFLIACGAEE